MATGGLLGARARATILNDPAVLARTGADIAKYGNQSPQPIFLAHFHPLSPKMAFGAGSLVVLF